MRRLRFNPAVAGIVIAASFAVAPPASAETWESSITPFDAPGSFPAPRPLRAHYTFGWGGFTAAEGDVRFTKSSDGRFRLEATGGTTGFARTLWRYDVKHVATSDARTLRPIRVKETEQVRSKTFETEVTFNDEGAVSVREERRGSSVKSKTRRFNFPQLWSLNSALLYLRTQPLQNGAVQKVVIYPATSAYLATITVAGRERITVPTGSYDAIKVNLQLAKIGKERELQPHKKFKHATVWLSDDSDRLVLRIETQVFIGTVSAELQSVQFENAKP